MRIAILESIVMPAGHEVEFDRILVEELKKQGHEPVFFVPENFPFKLFGWWRSCDLCRGGKIEEALPLSETRKATCRLV